MSAAASPARSLKGTVGDAKTELVVWMLRQQHNVPWQERPPAIYVTLRDRMPYSLPAAFPTVTFKPLAGASLTEGCCQITWMPTW